MYPENPEETQVILGSMNMGYVYIRHRRESNSQPVPFQAGVDTTRPQWQIVEFWFLEIFGVHNLCYNIYDWV